MKGRSGGTNGRASGLKGEKKSKKPVLQSVVFTKAGTARDVEQSLLERQVGERAPELGRGIVDPEIFNEFSNGLATTLGGPVKGHSYWVKQKQHQSDPEPLTSDSSIEDLQSDSASLSEDTKAALLDYANNASDSEDDDSSLDTRPALGFHLSGKNLSKDGTVSCARKYQSFVESAGTTGGMDMPLYPESFGKDKMYGVLSMQGKGSEVENALAKKLDKAHLGSISDVSSDFSDSWESVSDSSTRSESKDCDAPKPSLIKTTPLVDDDSNESESSSYNEGSEAPATRLKTAVRPSSKRPTSSGQGPFLPLEAEDLALMSRAERKRYLKNLVSREESRKHSASNFDARHDESLMKGLTKSAQRKAKKNDRKEKRLNAQVEAEERFYKGVCIARQFAVTRLDSPALLEFLEEQNREIYDFVRDYQRGEELVFPFIPGPVRKLVAQVGQNYGLVCKRQGKAENSVLVLARRASKSVVPKNYEAIPEKLLSERISKAQKRVNKGIESMEHAMMLKSTLPNKLQQVLNNASAQKLNKQSQRRSEGVSESVRIIEKSYMEMVKGDKRSASSSSKGANRSAHLKVGQVVGEHAPSLDESNRGHKMLQIMGWKPGDSIGKDASGGTRVEVVVRRKNAGLGS